MLSCFLACLCACLSQFLWFPSRNRLSALFGGGGQRTRLLVNPPMKGSGLASSTASDQGKTDVVTTEGGAGHDHSHRFANLLGVRLKVRNAWPGSQTRNGIRKPSQTELGNPKVRKPSPGFVRGRRRPGAALARSCQRRRRPGAALARSCQRRRRLGAALAA